MFKIDNRKPVNIFRDVLPTADSTWGTAPTNLANCTDGDITTKTGAGLKTSNTAANIGIITIDLGSVKTVLVGGTVSMFNDKTLTQTVYVEADEGSGYKVGGGVVATMLASNEAAGKLDLLPSILTGRYIRFRFRTNATGSPDTNSSVIIYSLMGYEIGV